MKNILVQTRFSKRALKKLLLVQPLIFILMLLPLLQASAVKPHQPPKKPNFILILTDDQGWTCMSSPMDDRLPNAKSDYFETPNIDRLARGGMRFTSGYAPAAICSPTRRSIQFGQSPARQGEERFKANYHPDNQKLLTIPSLLKSIDSHYQTAHYGKWDLRADIFPEDLGYDESDGDTGNGNGNVFTDKSTKWTEVYVKSDPKRVETLTARALNFMERQTEAGNPFYMQVSHYATHVDIQTREETYQKYLDKEPGSIHTNPGWAGMLEDLDTGIGEILDKVEALGIADHTYIIFMTDNGAAEFVPPVKNKLDHPSVHDKKSRNYPLRGGKWVLYEGGIRVPFFVMGPGIKPGSQSNVPVVGWDILPTLSDLAGNTKPLPNHLEGGSIKSLLEKGDAGTVQRLHEALVFHRYSRGYPHSAIRLGDYKLLKFWNTNKLELYNLKEDLGETQDLSAAMPQKAKALEEKLMNYLKEVNAEILEYGK